MRAVGGPGCPDLIFVVCATGELALELLLDQRQFISVEQTLEYASIQFDQSWRLLPCTIALSIKAAIYIEFAQVRTLAICRLDVIGNIACDLKIAFFNSFI